MGEEAVDTGCVEERGGADDRRIQELPDDLKNQIAAGEVIERPAAAVKELVENAIDAGAQEIRVELEEGGARRIRVVDDGAGMGPEDLRLAFMPFATSKLRALDDLQHIASLGFRGEALASIGSVARVRIVSRRQGVEEGFQIQNEGGRIEGPEAVGARQGTSVEVDDLFFNTPARKAFLKRPATELTRCIDILQRLALAHPGVGFAVEHEGRRVLDVEASMDLRERIQRAFGAELADALEPVEATDGTMHLAGFVAPPRFARRDASRQMWFLNGRPLRDRVLVRALKEAYRGSLFEGRQPAAFLHLSLDPSRVDVNVHPTKSEVRFRDGRRLFGFLLTALRQAVERTDMATPGSQMFSRAARRLGNRPGGPYLPDPGPGPSGGGEPAPRQGPGAAGVSSGGAAGAVGEAAAPWEASDDGSGPFLQVARTYLIRTLADGFEVIDQHALHERITYDRLLEEARRGEVEVQRLLVPEIVEASASEVRCLEEHVQALAAAGVILEPFGPGSIAVGGMPARLRNPDPEALVREVLAVVERTGEAPSAERILEEFLHRTACRSSVMAGDELSADEIRSLLSLAAAIPHDQTCPHGRPTRVRFGLADLETAFLRRG